MIEKPVLKYINLNLLTLKTNAKTFKTPVKICFYDILDNIFIIALESMPTVTIFD